MKGSLFFLLNFVVVTMLTSLVQAAPKDIYFRQIKEQRFSKLPPVTLQEDYFSQKLNHDDPSDTRTFRQRFYVDTSWALNSESPTILYICGEATCSIGEVETGEVSSVASRL